MGKGSKKRLRFIIILLCLGIIGALASRIIILNQIEEAINNHLMDLQKKGYSIHFSSLSLNIWRGDIIIKDLQACIGEDSINHQTLLSAPEIIFKGIQILPYLKNDDIIINNINVNHPIITHHERKSITDQHHVDTTQTIEPNNIRIKKIALEETSIILKDSIGLDTLMQIHLSFQSHDLSIDRNRKRKNANPDYKQLDLSFNNILIHHKKSLYNYTIKSAKVNLLDREIALDSISIKPILAKHAFMKKVSKQTDRIEGDIPYVKIHGFDFKSDSIPSIIANHIESNFNLFIFRDKRYQHVKTAKKQLPVVLLKQLPFNLKIDSLSVVNANISYEEFPEKGDSSGYVSFHDFNATMKNIHNDTDRHDDITLQIRSKLMNNGTLQGYFTLPTDSLKPYTAKGSLKNLSLPSLNSILVSATQLKIESGIMHEMKFNFSYNDYVSNGNIEMNYENLKVTYLTENNKQQQSVSPIKTFILNTFIVKKKMDSTIPKEARSGTIYVIRDTQRSIFNYWWKSLLSGLKSAYNVDTKEKNKKRKKK